MQYPFKLHHWEKWNKPFDDRSDALREVDSVRLEKSCIAVACYGDQTPQEYIRQQIEDRKASLEHLHSSSK